MAVTEAWSSGSDVISVLQSTDGTRIGALTRRITSNKQAVKGNGDSRVFVECTSKTGGCCWQCNLGGI